MIKVQIAKSSNYQFSKVFIRQVLQQFFKKNGIVSDSVIEVSFVSKEKMLEIGSEYLGEVTNQPHNVLSFPATETKEKFVFPPDLLYLGEIVVCYPVAVEEAQRESVTIATKLEELVTHGGLHILGQHHK